MSEETKKIFKGRLRPVGAGIPSVAIEVLDLETGIKTVYSSIGETARALDVAQSSISYYFSPKYKLKPNSKSALCKGRYKLSQIFLLRNPFIGAIIIDKNKSIWKYVKPSLTMSVRC